MHEFTLQSDLAIGPDEFWAANTMKSVNWELSPIVRMTALKEWRSCPINQWEVGCLLFKSWILLFGIIPIDRHSFKLRRIYEGSGFLESSSSWVNKEWLHERRTTVRGSGCTITDHVTVVGRFPMLTNLLMPVYRFIFRHRHRRLRRNYGR
jgi:hypothetical protein